MRAIDADAMIDRLKEWNTKDKTDKALYNFTMNRINEQPTIQPEPHWIPVTERLPKVGESVMICDAYGDICIGHRTNSGYYFPDFCEDKIKDVRAWAELPEPYKGVNT